MNVAQGPAPLLQDDCSPTAGHSATPGTFSRRPRTDCLYLSEALASEPIALEPADDECWFLHYGRILLGTLDRRGKFAQLRAENVLPMCPDRTVTHVPDRSRRESRASTHVSGAWTLPSTAAVCLAADYPPRSSVNSSCGRATPLSA